MKDLKCGLRDCKHNKGYSCCAKKIQVDNFTDCLTYEKSPEKKKVMFEAAGDFVAANYSVDTAVGCTAKCIFNRDDKCKANGITVMGAAEEQACCMTFVKK